MQSFSDSLLEHKGTGEQKGTGISQLFTSLELGYRFRAGKPADELPYYFELGYNVWKRLWLKGTLDGVESRPFGGGAEEDYHQWIVAVLLSKDPSQRVQPRTPGLEIGTGRVFAGKNTGVGQTVFLKLSYQF